MATSFPTSIDDQLLNSRYICCICAEVYTQPCHPKTCSHTFCLKCLVSNTKSKSQPCPLCKTVFDISELQLDANLVNEIQDLHYQCTQCSKTVKLTELNKHRESVVCQIKPNHQLRVNLSKVALNRSTFQCPFCNVKNLDLCGLRDHCNDLHMHEDQRKVCPVCSSMPWGDNKQISQDFLHHMNLRHKFEYETYVDYGEEEDVMLQAALKASLQSN